MEDFNEQLSSKLIESVVHIIDTMFPLLTQVHAKLESLEKDVKKQDKDGSELLEEIHELQNDVAELIKLHDDFDYDSVVKKAAEIITAQDVLSKKFDEITHKIIKKDDISILYQESLNKLKNDISEAFKTAVANGSFSPEVVKKIYETIREEEKREIVKIQKEKKEEIKWWAGKWFYLIGAIGPMIVITLGNMWITQHQREETKKEIEINISQQKELSQKNNKDIQELKSLVENLAKTEANKLKMENKK
jgi:hypothetical protein